MSFFALLILDFKIVPNDAELNSAPGIKLIFQKKVGVVTRKAANFEKVVPNLKKMSFDSTKLKTRKWWDQTLCIFKTPGTMAPA